MRRSLHRLSAGLQKNRFAELMRECSRTPDLADARRIHAQMTADGLSDDVHLGNQLVQVYLKCGSVEEARHVFDGMSSRGRLAWTAIISAYIQQGEMDEAFWLFQGLLQEGETVDAVTFVAVLNACSDSSSACLARGNAVHGWIVESGLQRDMIVANALMSMYSKRNRMDCLCQIFEGMSERNVVSWTIVLAAYTRLGHLDKAARLFRLMQLDGVKPNTITFTAVLSLFTAPEDLPFGRAIHCQIAENGFDSATVVANALIHMYASCGDLHGAVRMFDLMQKRDVISWNALMNAYAQSGHMPAVMKLFRQMQAEGMKPDRATFLSILNAAGRGDPKDSSGFMSSCIAESGYGSNAQIGNALLSLHAKTGSLHDAQRLFHRGIHNRDVVSWTAMIGAYSQHLQPDAALHTFRGMLQHGIAPNRVTFLAVLGCCRSLTHGCFIQSRICELGFDQEPDVATALVNMYGNCGAVDLASRSFDAAGATKSSLALWNVLIAAYAQNGHFQRALTLFWVMQQDWGLKPDEITMNVVLSACGHAGLIGQGCLYFASMESDYELNSNYLHYSCLVDLLGRAGHLQEAEKIINSMPVQTHQSLRMAFLSACKSQNDRVRGNQTAKQVLQLYPSDHSGYVMASHLHAC